MTGKAFRISVLAVVAAAVLLHLFFFSRGFYAIGWDESGRTLDAYLWATQGLVTVDAWLPIYRLLVGAGLQLHPDLVITPRVISFAFGLASMIACGWLTHELFGNRRITLLALTLSACLPQRVVLSLAPLSEIMFMAPTLAAVAMLARWLRTDRTSALLSCAAFGAVATGVRYEGWVFAGAIFLVVAGVVRSSSTGVTWRGLLLFAVILFAFASVWSVTSFALGAVRTVIADAQRLSMREIVLRNPIVEFAIASALSLNGVGVLAVVSLAARGTRRERAILAASFGPLLVIAAFLLLARSAQTGPAWRMAAVWSMLLLPFTAFVLSGGSLPSPTGTAKRAIAAGAIALVLGLFVRQTFVLEKRSAWAFPSSDRAVGAYLEARIRERPQARILIESSGFFYLNAIVASQHVEPFVLNSVPEQESVPVLAVGSAVRDVIKRQRIDYLVFFTDEFKAFLDASGEVVKLDEFGPWSVYGLRGESDAASGVAIAATN